MIRKTDEFVARTNVRGGVGTIEMHNLLNEGELGGKVKMLARIVLPAYASIGYHQHTEDWEHYYILSGTGVFTGPDEVAQDVVAGDMCMIKKGESHALSNDGEGPMEILAIILE
ncbi:MAG: cupin domain-containing protein [Clostridiales bacterium]|nr:cupin domain-containing protein [Clostridiales bacterium]